MTRSFLAQSCRLAWSKNCDRARAEIRSCPGSPIAGPPVPASGMPKKFASGTTKSDSNYVGNQTECSGMMVIA
jgi:hypothetical protein